MKKNRFLGVLLISIVLLCSGCTKYVKGVTNEKTGQSITSNILCLPEGKELLDLYETNKDELEVEYSSLEKCQNFKPSNLAYKSLWESIFVKPLAWLIIKLGLLVRNYGLSVIIIGIVIRLILMPFTKKTLAQSENMKKAQPEIARIQSKYANSTDQASSMQMSQEMMAVYQKYHMNPAIGCLVSFIQLPILLAFLEAINRVPAIFEGSFLSLELGMSPFVGIKSGNLMYIILIAGIILTTYYSYKISMSASSGNSEQDKQMAGMMKMMIAFISIASLSLPTALALYWITSNCFMIIQNKLLKKNKDKKKVKKEKVKLAKIKRS